MEWKKGQTGIIKPKMDMEIYHAAEGTNLSLLKKFMKAPAYYKAEVERKAKGVPEKSTPAKEFGKVFHDWALEGIEPVAAPSVDRRTKKGKEVYAEFLEENKGKNILKFEDMEIMKRMVESVRSHPVAGTLFEGGLAEQSIWWKDDVTGLLCKCRPDYMNQKKGLVVDLKSTADVSPEGFARSVANYGYYLQNSFYMDGIETVLGKKFFDFLFVAVEKEEPYITVVYDLDPQAIWQGRSEYRESLTSLDYCIKNDYWPGYADEKVTLSLPRWARGNNEIF